MKRGKVNLEKLGITPNGGYYSGYPSRIESKEDLEEIEICKKWILKYCKPRKYCLWSVSSYRLKHVVEKSEGRYVSNGAFIQACIDLGYTPHFWGDSWLNLYFNISIDPSQKV